MMHSNVVAMFTYFGVPHSRLQMNMFLSCFLQTHGSDANNVLYLTFARLKITFGEFMLK